MVSQFLKRNLLGVVFFLLLAGVSIHLTYKTHENAGYYSWKSEIWADKAGYYIYLPATFMYHFDPTKAPEKIDEKLGYGFTMDMEKKTINTKYTYGVSAMVAPFFIIARVISPLLKVPGEGGFSPIFNKMVNFAAVFYMILGLFFLKKFLDYYFKSTLSYIIVFFIYAGTNLFYYSVNDTLMSHVYSFFLFSLFLFSLKKFFLDKERRRYFYLLSFTFGIALLIRPTNILLLLLFFVWDIQTTKEISERVKAFVQPRRLVAFLAILFLIFLPQMVYWKYSRGSYIAWSYTNEGFTNWSHPRIAEVWFSTLNGLFIYTPIIIFVIIGIVMMIKKGKINGWIVLAFFLIVSYIAASWYNWYFGCSFGQRSFVEYLTIFALPFGIFIESIPKIRNLLFKSILIFVFLFSTYYNVRMSMEFEKCFFGSSWDWAQFSRQLGKAGIFKSYIQNYSFNNDFENQALVYSYQVSDSVKHSGIYSARIAPEKEFTGCYSISLKDLGEQLPKSLIVDYWLYTPGISKTEALLICTLSKNDSVLVWQKQPLPQMQRRPSEWENVTAKFVLPDLYSREPLIKIYFWNPKKSLFYIDDLTINYQY